MTELRPVRAQTFTVGINGSDCHWNIFKIGFAGSDGSLWVAFPYFQKWPGLVSVLNLPPGSTPVQLDLTTVGRVTSHLVKYSHHRSGLALFSQSGKVVSSIRKQSISLSCAEGHLFSIQLKSLDGFKRDAGCSTNAWLEGDTAITGDAALSFDVKGDTSSISLKFVAHCYNKRRLRERLHGRVVGPWVSLVNQTTGTRGQGILVAAPKSLPGAATYLVLEAHVIPNLTDLPGPHLTFIGGFDSPEVARDPTGTTSFLACLYPAADYQELKELIGSIDFAPELGRLTSGN